MAAILKNGRHLFRAAYLPGCPPRKCSGRCPKHVDTKQPFTAFHVRLTPLAPWVSSPPPPPPYVSSFSSPSFNHRSSILLHFLKRKTDYHNCWKDFLFFTAGIGGFFSLGLAIAGFHITSLRCGPFISIQTIIIKYIVFWVFKVRRHIHWDTFVATSKNCVEEQASFLMNKIREHEKTTYGRDFRFEDILSVEDFRRQHPLTKYEHYKNYIDRVARGEVGVMSHRIPRIFGKTSGTTGEPKIYPVSVEVLNDFGGLVLSCLQVFQGRSGFRQVEPLQMTSNLLTATPIYVTEGGIPAGAMSSYSLTDDVKKIMFTTPPECFHSITHEPTAMYIHALFALRDRQLGGLFAPFSSSVFVFLKCLEQSWESVVRDIRRGWVSDNLAELSDKDRRFVNERLEPMPERAGELEREFRNGFDGIVGRIWPHIPFITGNTSGAMQTYVERLKKFTGGT